MSNGADTYPTDLRAEIAELDAWLGLVVNQGVNVAAGTGDASAVARDDLREAFADLDSLLHNRRYLVGAQLTEADVRLWVSLVRYDAASNAGGRIGASLDEFPSLWDYARDLYQQPAFTATTDFTSFTSPAATVPDWNAPHDRVALAEIASRAPQG